MARDTQTNPRGQKPALPEYTGATIDVDKLDANGRYEVSTYLAHRYYGSYPKPRANPLGKYHNDPRSMVRLSSAESYRGFVNAGNGGSMDLTHKAQFEAEHPGFVAAYEEWVEWAWSINSEVR